MLDPCESSASSHDSISKENEKKVFVHKNLVANLISAAITALPKKAYGIIGGYDLFHPISIYQCHTNLRNTDPYWKERIDSFGEFYRDPERGFVIDPSELLPIHKNMRNKNEKFVGVFHSHRCFVRGEPSEIDRVLHLQCQPGTISYILEVWNPTRPILRVFDILNENEYEELEFKVIKDE